MGGMVKPGVLLMEKLKLERPVLVTMAGNPLNVVAVGPVESARALGWLMGSTGAGPIVNGVPCVKLLESVMLPCNTELLNVRK